MKISIFPMILFGILLQMSIPVSAQKQHDSIVDFNKDGYLDTLSWHYDGGSGFGGVYCSIINGKSHEKIELDTWGCFCDIKRVILIPPQLCKKENQSFLQAIKNTILPKHQDSTDPSLQWILSATDSNNDSLIHPYFSQKILVKPNWLKEKMSHPEYYHIDIEGKELNKIYYSEGEKPDWYDVEKNKGWLSYSGMLHFTYFMNNSSYVLRDSSEFYKIYSTNHGLVVKRKEDYAWLFVTDRIVTGAPEKLRWASIGKIVRIDHYIFLQHKLPPSGVDQLYIIDIESGLSVKMKEYVDSDGEFSLEKDELSYLTGNLPNKYSIKELFKQMKLLNK